MKSMPAPSLLAILLLAAGSSLSAAESPAPAQPAESAGNAAGQEASFCFWYRQPATNWNEALPLGDGRLGAMVFGTANKERLQLNEESLWAGWSSTGVAVGFSQAPRRSPPPAVRRN